MQGLFKWATSCGFWNFRRVLYRTRFHLDTVCGLSRRCRSSSRDWIAILNVLWRHECLPLVLFFCHFPGSKMNLLLCAQLRSNRTTRWKLGTRWSADTGTCCWVSMGSVLWDDTPFCRFLLGFVCARLIVRLPVDYLTRRRPKQHRQPSADNVIANINSSQPQKTLQCAPR